MSRGDVVLAGGAALGGALAVILAAEIRRRLVVPRFYVVSPHSRSAIPGRGLPRRETISADAVERFRLAAAI